jgi:uncharacterized protein (TIGR03086 family)
VTERIGAVDSTLDTLEVVLRTTQDVTDQVRSGDLTHPTPCAEFDVRRLLEHIIGWQQVSGACAADLEPPLAEGSPTYTASLDLAGDLRDATTTLLTRLRARSEETITLPYRGATSVSVMHSELIAESVIHTWDLAAALGVSVEFDDHVVSVAHDGLSLLLGESFAEIGFRSPAATDPDSSELARLLVRSGRSPGDWATT